jgi:hypothetical protein
MSGAESDGLLTPEEEEELPPELRCKWRFNQFAGDFQVNVTPPRT